MLYQNISTESQNRICQENHDKQDRHERNESPRVLPTVQQRRSADTPNKQNDLSHICECEDFWTWSTIHKSHEVRLYEEFGKTVHFHPNWSNGTAAARAEKVLNGGIYYWEIKVSQRVFGTSMMFGIGTSKTRLHVDAFVNLLGEDNSSMGLSHKGIAWCSGTWKQYTKPFRENEATTIGLLFDGIKGTLTYYKDGQSLGIAFTGLDKIKENLYPIVCSTAAKTEMTLANCRRCYTSLQDRCRRQILLTIDSRDSISTLPLPYNTKDFLHEEPLTTFKFC